MTDPYNYQNYPVLGGGGFTPNLNRRVLDVSPGPAFLADEEYTPKLGGVTYAQSKVPADADGNRIILEGTLNTPITDEDDPEFGKYAPYDPDAADGRQTISDQSVYNFEALNLRFGDVIAGGLFRGVVRGARVHPQMLPGVSSTVRQALAGRILFQ